MSLFDLFAFVCLIYGAVSGAVGALSGGFVATLWGLLSGAGLGFAFYCVTMFLICGTLCLFLHYRPPFPTCRHGKCSAEKYLYLYLDTPATGLDKEMQDSVRGLLARCQCGTTYLLSCDHRRIWEVLPDGTLSSFMCYRPFGRWQVDTEPPLALTRSQSN